MPRMRDRRLVWLGIGLTLALVVGAAPFAWRAVVNTPPEAPVVVDPPPSTDPVDGLRLELAPFADRDGDAHQATDWEIRAAADDALVWTAQGTTEPVHVPLAAGEFQGSQALTQRLDFSTAYVLRVRAQDARGAWSPWTEQSFVSPMKAAPAPWRVRGVLAQPAPRWRTDGDAPVGAPSGASVTLEAGDGTVFLALAAAASELAVTPGPLRDRPEAVRLRLSAPPTAAWTAPPSVLSLVGVWADRAERLTIALPALALPAGGERLLWVTEAGATFVIGPDGTLDRTELARDTLAQWVVPPGYRAEVMTSALQLPTSLAFVQNPGTDPNAPRYYVTELYGRLKVVTNDGRILPFADQLLNLTPTGIFPGSGEMGVVGVCLPPTGHDVYVTMVFRDQANSLRNKLVRLRSDDGLSADAAEDLLVVKPGQGLARAAHQMQQCSFGPDGKLYVSIGDGTAAANALNDTSFGGKLIRLNPDGSAPTDNPFYDPAQPTAPISYMVAKGLRNAYGQTWRLADGQLYLTDNGPNIDRVIRLTPGANYGWDGSDASMYTNAAYTWPESRWSPVGLAFVEGPGAAVLAPDRHGQLLVASSGLVYYKGAMHAGKAIQAFTLNADGSLTRSAARFASYVGEGHGTVIDLKLQPDGLYFTNLYLSSGEGGAVAPGGQVWRIRYVGEVTATASTRRGPAPLAVTFGTAGTPAGARGCAWSFGDGQTSTDANPRHTFQQPGVYAVSLTCAGAAGQPASERLLLVTVTDRAGGTPQPAPVARSWPIAPAAESVVFPETGMTLTGAFKQFWDANGGVITFGYPLTPAVLERGPGDGRERLVQYFERARFEAEPGQTDVGAVRLGALGREATARRAGDASFRELIGGAMDSTPDRRVFAETRHSLSGPFLRYWTTTGGDRIYGPPISEPLYEVSATDGKRYQVQYFERARMEYHPEAAGTPQEMQLARLGAVLLVNQPAARAQP